MTDEHGALRPGPLGEPTVVDRVEVRVSGWPDPMRDQADEIIGEFPRYEHIFQTDSENWRYLAGIAARALTQWTDGEVTMRRVRIETRTSDWSPVELDALIEGGLG